MTYLAEVHGPAGDYFIRSAPWNHRMDALAWFAPLQRLLGHDHSWVVVVHKYNDDPFGAIVYSERVASKADVPPAIEQLEQVIRSGNLADWVRGEGSGTASSPK